MIKYFTSILGGVLVLMFFCIHHSCTTSSILASTKNDSAVFKFSIINKDFGSMKEGYVASYTFEFINVGNKNLLINNVETECSCTISEFTKTPILPNGKGFIKISYKSAGNGGAFNKSITIRSNATEPFKVLHIKGLVFGTIH